MGVMASFRFESRWLLDAPLDAAYDVLADVEQYPAWWPQVRAVAKLGEDHALVVCRSVLPFDLDLELWPAIRDPRGVLEVAIGGDLVGWSRFTLDDTVHGLHVHYEQEVDTRRRLLDLTRIARGAVRANHAWMMRSARVGLAVRLAASARAAR